MKCSTTLHRASRIAARLVDPGALDRRPAPIGPADGDGDVACAASQRAVHRRR